MTLKVHNYIEMRSDTGPLENPSAIVDASGTPESSSADLNLQQYSRTDPSLRMKWVTASGESHEIEIFDLGLAEKWVISDPWGLRHSTGPIDE